MMSTGGGALSNVSRLLTQTPLMKIAIIIFAGLVFLELILTYAKKEGYI